MKRDVKSSGFVMYSNSTFIFVRKGLKVLFFFIFHRHVSCDVPLWEHEFIGQNSGSSC